MYKLVGFYHRKGKSSKTGNDYEFFQCSFISPWPPNNSDCEGFEALNVNISPDVFYSADLAGNLQKDFVLAFNRFGRLDTIQVYK